MKKNCRKHNVRKGATSLKVLLLCVLLALAASFSAMTSGPVSFVKPKPKAGDIVVRHADQISYDEALMPGVQIFVGCESRCCL